MQKKNVTEDDWIMEQGDDGDFEGTLSYSFSFTPPNFPKSSTTLQLLLNVLSDNFVFDSIDDTAKVQFVMLCK